MPEAQQVEPRPSTVVVTSENRAEFMNKKLDIAAPQKAESAEPVVVAEEPKVEAEPVKAEPKAEEPKKEEPKAEPKEKTHPIKERFSELTQQREAARAETAKEKERADKAEREAADLRAKLNPPAKDAPTEPKREQFANDEEFGKALVDHRVDVRLAERDKEQREATAKAEETKVLASWAEKVTAIKQSVPDFAEKIDASPVQVAPYVRDAILDSEVGPRMLLHLAENKAEAEALGRMSAVRALKEIGKLEEKYLKGAPKAEPKAEPKAPEVEISKAPAPINPLKGASAPLEAPVNAQGEYVGTYAQWKALRKAGKIH